MKTHTLRAGGRQEPCKHKAVIFTIFCLVVYRCAPAAAVDVTQQDMLKHAIRRPSEDDQSNVKSPADHQDTHRPR